MIVFHVAIATHPEYLTRREPHRRAHIERLAGLRQVGAVIGGGPAPDGSRVEIVYRLQQPAQLKPAIEEDPYWVGGAWTAYRERSFSEFVEPWRLPEIVLDGSRRVTVVEGQMSDPDMAQFVMIEMRGAGRLVFGGAFEGGATHVGVSFFAGFPDRPATAANETTGEALPPPTVASRSTSHS